MFVAIFCIAITAIYCFALQDLVGFAELSEVILLILLFPATILTGVICSIVTFFISYGCFKKHTRSESYLKEIANLEKELSAIKTKGRTAVDKCYRKLVFLVPKDYQYSKAIDKYASYFQNGRVTSMGEAVNLYETELYRQRMEARQIKALNIQ